MSIRSLIGQALGGTALVVLAVTPAALAKDSGSFSIQCLASDSALQQAEGITDATGPVTVAITPAKLWPPNHKFRNVSASASLTQAFAANPPAAPYTNGADITIWIVGISDDQDTNDDAGGHGCGKPTAKQGLDWSPDVELATTTSYVAGTATLSGASLVPLGLVDQNNAPVDLKLRGERCARVGTRTYEIDVVCCDNTDPQKVVCDDAGNLAVEPTTFESLDVTVPKSRRHKGEP